MDAKHTHKGHSGEHKGDKKAEEDQSSDIEIGSSGTSLPGNIEDCNLTFREAPCSKTGDISPITPRGGENDNSNAASPPKDFTIHKEAVAANDRVRLNMTLFEGVHEQVMQDVFDKDPGSPSPGVEPAEAGPTAAAPPRHHHRLRAGGFIEAIGLRFPSHACPVVMMPHTGVDYRYTLKEGELFEVYVQLMARAPIRGLHFSNTVYKFGLPVDRTKRELGSLPASAHPHVLYAITERAPAGVLMRGSYKGNVLIVAADGEEMCSFNYRLDVKRQWDEGDGQGDGQGDGR